MAEDDKAVERRIQAICVLVAEAKGLLRKDRPISELAHDSPPYALQLNPHRG
jgi:hypothetical protein